MDCDVAIVGSGFSAIAVTIHLLRILPASASIAVIGDDPGFGRGTAYRSEFHLHWLNVPAGRMSVFPQEPNHFIDWLTARGRPASVGDFAARGDYGLYLRDTLASLLKDRPSRARLDFIRAKATDCVACDPRGIVFHLANGETLRAGAVALCLGVGTAGLPLPSEAIARDAEKRIVRNPWRLKWLSKVRPDHEICILGSGLTMIDQVLTLRAHGHRGRIHVLSRRGLVPHPHAASHGHPVDPEWPCDGNAISDLLAAFRRQVRAGAEWRSLVDGLRPRTQALWQRLTHDQRARFLRHALAWWNIHRHRISPQVFETFDGLRDDGTVMVHAGFLKAIDMADARIAITFRARGTNEDTALPVDWVVNCTGMERAGISHSPLLTGMADRGMVRPDALGLGLGVDATSRVVDREGRAHPRLFAVGALTAGQFWEITAVPDIRMQAKAVAEALANERDMSAPWTA